MTLHFNAYICYTYTKYDNNSNNHRSPQKFFLGGGREAQKIPPHGEMVAKRKEIIFPVWLAPTLPPPLPCGRHGNIRIKTIN